MEEADPTTGFPAPEELSNGVISEANEVDERGGWGLPAPDPVEPPDSRSSITKSIGILLLRQAM